eukprot:TRINITY_DN71761_c0_g1_i1.p1 TRINITY_DN71761_c0_g1~~TRINITY_DN71761_c0_g1_i1.p1  ORF type:complete len:320 (-),score=80.89 TRINITY_DN71761_c0_g1_i1:307-1266(-)
MAAAVAANPVSVPTALGAREVVDLSASVLNFQRLEDPQTSLHQCGTKYGAQVVRAIFEKLEQQGAAPTFEELNLSDNQIGDEGATYLAEGLAGSKSLKRLLLPRAGIKAAGFAALGGLLANAPSMEEIVLSSNVCGLEGLKGPFCTGLSTNTTLKSLYLGACRLGAANVEALCKGPMKKHPSIEHLSLTYNRLEASSVPALNAMLASNPALYYLDLSGNSIGPDGAQALVAGLRENHGRLRKLSVAQNEIRLEGARSLTRYFMHETGKSMEFLDVRHNLVTYKGMQELRDELKRPLSGEEGWMLLFGEHKERQLLLNAH